MAVWYEIHILWVIFLGGGVHSDFFYSLMIIWLLWIAACDILKVGVDDGEMEEEEEEEEECLTPVHQVYENPLDR